MQTDATTVRDLGEACPGCRSADVRAVEPEYFVIELDRGDEVRSPWVADVEFTCRACGIVWH